MFDNPQPSGPLNRHNAVWCWTEKLLSLRQAKFQASNFFLDDTSVKRATQV